MGLLSPPESGPEGLAMSTQLGWLPMFWGAGGGKGHLIKTPPVLTSSFQNLPPEILKIRHVASHRLKRKYKILSAGCSPELCPGGAGRGWDGNF